MVIYFYIAGIDVVRALFPWNLSQFHTWEIIYGRNSGSEAAAFLNTWHLQGKIFANLFRTLLQGFSATICDAWGFLLKDCSKRETSHNHRPPQNACHIHHTPAQIPCLCPGASLPRASGSWKLVSASWSVTLRKGRNLGNLCNCYHILMRPPAP